MKTSRTETTGTHNSLRDDRRNLDKWQVPTKIIRLLLLAILALHTNGCGTFVAKLIARAPNRYPTWIAPEPPVTLAFNPKLLTNFVTHYVDVGPPAARLCYRVIEPADYQLKVSSTNWLEEGRKQFKFSFQASVPAQTNLWSSKPRGTVLLLHGYGVAQFAMLPRALRLAEEGWRSVLVDLRGHGKSTGKRVYFGLQETGDMRQLLNALAKEQKLIEPVAMVGESYGAILALRCEATDDRIRSVVAIAPYSSFSNTVLNIRQEYASWFPKTLIKSGVKHLPSVLQIPGEEFDTTTRLKRNPVAALFVAGGEDKVTSAKEVESLYALALPDSKLIVVPDITHEALTYAFVELDSAVLKWLAEDK